MLCMFFYFYITRAHARAIVLVKLEKTYTTYTNKNTLLFFKTGEGFPVFNIHTTYTQHTHSIHKTVTSHQLVIHLSRQPIIPGSCWYHCLNTDILHKADQTIDPLYLWQWYTTGEWIRYDCMRYPQLRYRTHDPHIFDLGLYFRWLNVIHHSLSVVDLKHCFWAFHARYIYWGS